MALSLRICVFVCVYKEQSLINSVLVLPLGYPKGWVKLCFMKYPENWKIGVNSDQILTTSGHSSQGTVLKL